MTVVKNCPTLEDAYQAKNLLENGGIEADVLDESVASSAPHLLVATGIRVAVADEQAVVARELLGLPPMENRTAAPPSRTPRFLILGIVLVAVASLFANSIHHSRASEGEAGQRKDYDRNGDGKPDKRLEYSTDGKLVRGYLDENFDGVWDMRAEYDDGVITKSEHDLDFDGTFDTVETYSGGVLQSQTITPGGVGNPLFRNDYKNGILDKRWEDPEQDGSWNTCISYDAMGREINRVTFTSSSR